MPRKSRHSKALQIKRREEQQYPQIPAVRQQVSAKTPKMVTNVPPASTPAHGAATKIARYPYVFAEMKRIGILAGIILTILVVLALVLH